MINRFVDTTLDFIKIVPGPVRTAAWNPDQPRDPNGKWSGAGNTAAAVAIERVRKRGPSGSVLGDEDWELFSEAVPAKGKADSAKVVDISEPGDHPRTAFARYDAAGELAAIQITSFPKGEKPLFEGILTEASKERQGHATKLLDWMQAHGHDPIGYVHRTAGFTDKGYGFIHKWLRGQQVRGLEFNPDQPRDETGKWSGSGGTATSAAEQATQEQRAAAQTNPLAHPAFVIGGSNNPAVHRYVAAYGEAHTPAPLPADIEQGTPRECYKNASLLVMSHPELTYAEGFAKSNRTGDMVFQHAWAVTKDGTVVDPTWDNPEKGQYFGVRYERAAYLKYLYTAKIYGVLGSTEKNVRMAVATGAPKLRTLAFNPDQPRDEHGRWTDTAGSMMSQPAAAFTPLHADGRDTREQFTDGMGHYTPERAALHKEIVKKYMHGTTPVEKPVATILGGGPASGKSTIVEAEGIGKNNTVMANVDLIRAELPEYREGLGLNKNISTITHEESSDVVKQLIRESIKTSRNVVVDGTGDSSLENLGGKVAVMRAGGHEIVAQYVTVDVETAVARAHARGEQTGRFVPETFIRATHVAVSRVFPEAVRQGLFDRAELFDTINNGKVHVATARGKELTIHDPAAWARFVEKGTK